MPKKKSFRNDIVYSTEENVVEEINQTFTTETPAPTEQTLYVEVDRKLRKGKSVTLVTGFVGLTDDLKQLGKHLKTKCGVGGTVKNGQIEIQGEFRDKIISELNSLGYNTKRKGG